MGTDNLRGYLLFCGPWEQGGDFSDRSLNGVVRFNARLFDLLIRPSPGGTAGSICGPWTGPLIRSATISRT